MKSSVVARVARRKASGAAVRAARGALRPLASFVLNALVLVPLHVMVIAGLLYLAVSRLARLMPPDSILQTAGSVSAAALAIGVGLVSGIFAGTASAARRTTDRLEAVLRDGLLGMDAGAGARVFPARRLADVRSGYEAILDAVTHSMFDRVPVPGWVHRLARRGLRQAPIEDFLAGCEARGVGEVGFTEIRNWAVAKGVPFALAPVRAKLRALHVLGLGIAAAALALALLLGLALRGAAA
jgi:hypothetical protein